MHTERFDLNHIEREPTEPQLESLMDSVASEARYCAKLAKEALMARLWADIAAANLRYKTVGAQTHERTSH